MNLPDGGSPFTGPVPPGLKPRGYKVLTPKAGETITAIVVSSKLLGCWTHFRDGVSYPCPGDPKQCVFTHTRREPRWKAYLAALAWPNQFRCHVELTVHAVNTCLGLTDPALDLRGWVIKTSRPAGKPNGKMRAWLEVQTQSMLKVQVPQEWDVKAKLLEMWGDPADYLLAKGVREPMKDVPLPEVPEDGE